MQSDSSSSSNVTRRSQTVRERHPQVSDDEYDGSRPRNVRRRSKSEQRITTASRSMTAPSSYGAGQRRATEEAENPVLSQSYPDIAMAVSQQETGTTRKTMSDPGRPLKQSLQVPTNTDTAPRSRPPPSPSSRRVGFALEDEEINVPPRYTHNPSHSIISEPVSPSILARYGENIPEYEPLRMVRSASSSRRSSFAQQHVEPASPQDNELPLTRPHSRDEEQAVAVLVMGLTGSGKSAFISLLADEAVEVGDDLTSSMPRPPRDTFRSR